MRLLLIEQMLETILRLVLFMIMLLKYLQASEKLLESKKITTQIAWVQTIFSDICLMPISSL